MQIGPRIRIGGTVGKALGAVQKVLPSPGQVAGTAALGVPGMLLGGSLPSNLGGANSTQKKIADASALVAGGIGGAGLLGGGAAGGAAGSAAHAIAPLGASATDLPSGEMLPDLPGLPGSGAAGDAAGGAGGGGWLDTLKGLGKGAAGWLTGNGGLNALGVAQGINSAMLQKKATDYANRAMQDVQGSYDERSPLRALGLSQLTHPVARDTSALTRTRTTGSPYAGG